MNKGILFGVCGVVLVIGIGAYVYSAQKQGTASNGSQSPSGSTSESATITQQKTVSTNVTTTHSVKTTAMTYLPNFESTNVTSDGKQLEYDMGSFTPIFRLSDIPQSELTTSSPVQALALYYSLLAKVDIDGASKISTDPANTSATLNAYLERVGEDKFKKQYEDGFNPTSSVGVSSVAKVGNDTYIVFLKTDSYTGANVLMASGNGYALVEDLSTLPQNVQDVVTYLTNQLNP